LNATTNGAQAIADKSDTIANAIANGAAAIAHASSTIANATVPGALATAAKPDSVAIAQHEAASVKADQGKVAPYLEFMTISKNLDRFCDMNNSNRADLAYAVGMAFCDGKGVKQSDTLATFFLSAAHELAHRYAAFELGELYSKKRSFFRCDQARADDWYSRENSDAKKVRELAPKYALLFEGLRDNKCSS
jgi:TPR repeat protein